MTKTRYDRAKEFLAEADPRNVGSAVRNGVAPWIINRVAELLPPEPSLSVQASAALEPLPEWGGPIPTPGGSCPEWLTLDDIKPGYVYTTLDGQKVVREVWPVHAGDGKAWVWSNIESISLRPNAPAYALLYGRNRAEQIAALEAQGYTVTPPAPPEPDYEAYREKLSQYRAGKGGSGRVAEPMGRMDKRIIDGLIAVGVTP